SPPPTASYTLSMSQGCQGRRLPSDSLAVLAPPGWLCRWRAAAVLARQALGEFGARRVTPPYELGTTKSGGNATRSRIRRARYRNPGAARWPMATRWWVADDLPGPGCRSIVTRPRARPDRRARSRTHPAH